MNNVWKWIDVLWLIIIALLIVAMVCMLVIIAIALYFMATGKITVTSSEFHGAIAQCTSVAAQSFAASLQVLISAH